jgi:retron-type reverse transcriptase
LADQRKRGAYQAPPVERVSRPNADGRQRPIGKLTLEDNIVQRATVEVLNAIYETELFGGSYGARPGRSPHHAVDAVTGGLKSATATGASRPTVGALTMRLTTHGW